MGRPSACSGWRPDRPFVLQQPGIELPHPSLAMSHVYFADMLLRNEPARASDYTASRPLTASPEGGVSLSPRRGIRSRSQLGLVARHPRNDPVPAPPDVHRSNRPPWQERRPKQDVDPLAWADSLFLGHVASRKPSENEGGAPAL
jgi:hypothetical protein